MDDNARLRALNETYPLRFREISLLRRSGCDAYIARADERKYLLRVVSPAFEDTAAYAMDITQYLYAQGFPVPRIVRTGSGELSFRMDGMLCTLSDFIEGREPDYDEGTGAIEKIEEIGELTSRMHRIMRDYPGHLTPRGEPFFIGRYLGILEKKDYPEKKLALFREYGAALWNRVAFLPTGYCHGDLHRGNLLLSPDGRITFLDFDTSCTACPAFDMMVMCDTTNYFDFDAAGYDRALRTRDRFLEGYLRVETFSNAQIDSFFDWIAIRHYQLQATIYEIFGMDHVKEAFIDKQLDWLMRWRDQCAAR
jgi:Ser/Thr protein kinase RdoA (MazF antagonist)